VGERAVTTLARVSAIDGVAWTTAPFRDVGELVELAGRCLEADGGLPLAADPSFLQRRWAGSEAHGIQERDGAGTLVAAGAVRPTSGQAGATFAGMVDPGARGRGLGAHLLDWGLSEAARRPGQVTVETESLTAEAEALFATRGLRQVFAEDVMRIDFAWGVPEVGWPGGIALTEWSAEAAGRFHAVYEAAFRERPGFPGLPAAEWIADVAEDDDFRPGWSVLATLNDRDVGFVTAADGWIVQVGVVPEARRNNLGGALVAEALRRMLAGGGTHAWLDVNVDNAAARLYRRLGFEHRGRRARYQRAA
jgi:mycothiol synthase